MEDLQQVETVSGGNAIVYYVPLTVSGGDAGTEQPPDDMTLWTKPLDDYTVTEGLLLLIFCAAVALLVSKFFGGFKWQR